MVDVVAGGEHLRGPGRQDGGQESGGRDYRQGIGVAVCWQLKPCCLPVFFLVLILIFVFVRQLQEWGGGPGKKRPAVIVGEVRNMSHEHINVNTFTLDVERALINSGKVDFVATKDERKGIRDERKDQDLNAREDTRNPMGRELGADFMLTGSINTIVDPSGDTQVRFYQVNMTLISLADNRKVWVGQKDIRKLVTRSKLRF